MALIDAVAFACELAMLALLAVTGARLGTGAVGLVLAIVLPLAAASIWSAWIAPRSARRLPDLARFVAQVALFGTTAVLAASAGMELPGIVFFVVATASFAATRTARSA